MATGAPPLRSAPNWCESPWIATSSHLWKHIYLGEIEPTAQETPHTRRPHEEALVVFNSIVNFVMAQAHVMALIVKRPHHGDE
jgi:hypothetical protein